MDDETPASRTPNEPSDEPSANREPAPSRNDRDESDRGEDHPGDGVDPPQRAERDRPERDRSGSDGDCDEACDPESMEYRLERLRLLRTVVTLAVVVARLIRSF